MFLQSRFTAETTEESSSNDAIELDGNGASILARYVLVALLAVTWFYTCLSDFALLFRLLVSVERKARSITVQSRSSKECNCDAWSRYVVTQAATFDGRGSLTGK